MSEFREQAKAAAPSFRAYARRHGLTYYEDWGVPAATQLLRHGFVQEVPNLALGDLAGGLENAWLAHASFSEQSGIDIAQHPFTIVIGRVPASIGFAVRVLCHDRNLSEEERSNPDADTEVIELDDRGVDTESVRFAERYVLSTDHDQDQLRVWQLFSPALIHWLTSDAPADFSFELQDGALCCFVPGIVAEPEGLDALCAGAARVYHRVVELSAGTPTGPAMESRAAAIEAELAAGHFSRPPKSVFAAARAFGWWRLPSPKTWRLAAEAFFRSYCAGIGFERIDDAAFRASHIETPIPGEITQIASGRLAEVDRPAWLILTQHEGRPGLGFSVFVVDPKDTERMYAWVGLEETKAAEREGIEITADNTSLIIWKPAGGARRRSAKQLDEFLAGARRLAVAAIEAGRP